MKKLPDSELELMMIIWDAKKPITRMKIEEELPALYDGDKLSENDIKELQNFIDEKNR